MKTEWYGKDILDISKLSEFLSCWNNNLQGYAIKSPTIKTNGLPAW
jgi:hypothetical protein